MLDMVAFAVSTLVSSDRSSSIYSLIDCSKESKTNEWSIHHREANGIGYQAGYSSLDFFSSISKSTPFFPFLDLRGHVFNNRKLASNVGLGFRFLHVPRKMVFGFNAFYDVRQGDHCLVFHQIGPGLEVLGSRWSLRLNGYFPVGERKRQCLKHDECAMKGVELTAGKELVRFSYADIYSSIGGYYFSSRFDQNAKGGLVRLASRLTPFFSIEAQASYDSLFKALFQAEVAVHIPFGHRKELYKDLPCSGNLYLSERVSESVPRFEIIVNHPKRK
jgi:hypothetical protein